jgi:hypothetical protein
MYALTGGVPTTITAPAIPYALFNSTNSHDITVGNDCTTSGELHCTATSGFDTPSGLGSPNGISGFSELPSPPTNLNAQFVSQTSASLSWTASSSSAGISGYYIYRDGVKIGSSTTTSFSDPNLTANTNYNYYVVAYDASGNLSGGSSTIVGTTYLPEDINEQGHVNLLDLSLLASKYGQTGPNLGRVDINHDGVVNLLDLSLLASKYGSE